MQRVNVVEAIEAALAAAEPSAAAKKIRLVRVLDSKAGPVSGDPTRLQQVIWNLLSNSIKFTPPGGEVILRGINVAGHTRIEVLDSGPGIPESERKAVFQRFYRADGGNQKNGFGLGLSIVAAIASLHGFALEVGTSELGGARLTLDCQQSLIPQT